MPEFIKNIWLLFFAMMVLGLFMSIPVEKHQKMYNKEVSKYTSIPQKRVDATLKYVEEINNGTQDLSKGLDMIPPRKYYIDSEDEEFYKKFPSDEHAQHKPKNLITPKTYNYQKPRYRRDKDNPKILHPYE